MTDKETYRAAVQAAVLCAKMLHQWPLPELLRDIEHAHAVGPILDPTLYRDKNSAMDEDAELLRAALPLWQIASKLAAAQPKET